MIRTTNRKEKRRGLTSLFVSTFVLPAFVAILIGLSLSSRPPGVASSSPAEGASGTVHRLLAAMQGKGPRVKRPPTEPPLPLNIGANPVTSRQKISKTAGNQAAIACPTTTVVVGPGNQTATGWQTLQAIFGEAPPDNGTQTYEVGPSTPPLGVGSLEFRIGTPNDWDEDVGYTMLNNTPLGNLTELSYSTFVETASNASQDFYAILVIDTNGDHTADDFLFFFPANQQGCSDNAPPQHAIVRNIWQQPWDARNGVWVSASSLCAAENSCGTANDPKTLADYLVCFPTARIINDDAGTPGDTSDDTPGLIIGYGGGGASVSNNFIGNLDNVRVGVSCNTTAFDFDPCVLTCPANITQANDPNQCGAVVTFAPTTNAGACGAVSCSPVSGSFFPVGTTTVTCTSAAGPSCMFTVKINDTQPPVISCPGSVNVSTTTSCPPSTNPASATFNVTATDNCPGATVVCRNQNNQIVTSGQPFPVGTTTVTCTATDASGHTATCSFPVNVFNGCLQDDSDPTRVVLFNAQTGQYRFCCGGTAYTGVGTVTVKGCVVTISHNTASQRVLITFDGGVNRGTASLQSPPGTTKCTITDRNTTNNTCSCP